MSINGNDKPMSNSAPVRTRTRLYDGDTFEYRGYLFKVEYNVDEDMREPWKEHDGHGVVSEWTRRDKAPGERVLCEDRGSRRYYDVQATMRLARKDQWGLIHCAVCGEPSGGIGTSMYGSVHQHGPTTHAFKPESVGKRTARAVDADFEYLRKWCNDEWQWLYAVVHLLDEDEEETGERESLGGIDGDHDHGKYLTEVAYELAEEILARVEVDEPDVQLSEN